MKAIDPHPNPTLPQTASVMRKLLGKNVSGGVDGGEPLSKASHEIFPVDSSIKMLTSNVKVMRDEEEKEKSLKME